MHSQLDDAESVSRPSTLEIVEKHRHSPQLPLGLPIIINHGGESHRV
jgi:hypothetical protein